MTKIEALEIATKSAKQSNSVFGKFSKNLVILEEAKKLCGLAKENHESGSFESNYDGQAYSVTDACPVIWGGSPCLFTTEQAIALEAEGVCERIV